MDENSDKFKNLISQLLLDFGSLLLDEETEIEEKSKPKLKTYKDKNGIIHSSIFEPYLFKGVETPVERKLTTEHTFYQEKEKQHLKSKRTANLTISLSKKEIAKLPTKIKQTFLVKGLAVNCRLRIDKHCKSYEIRYRKDGYNISASGKTVDIAKARFLEKIKRKQKPSDVYPKRFIDFAKFFLENYQKKKVCHKIFKVQKSRLEKEFKLSFGKFNLDEITPIDCQKFLDDIIKQGHGNKAEACKSQLNQIFAYAKKLNLISVNPIDIIVFKKHERKHGTALSKQEEKLLLEKVKGTAYELQFAVALYTGMRPNEYKSAYIENGFVIAKNSKRKNDLQELKKIPITPMLAPYITNCTQLQFFTYNHIKEKFKSILPNHKLYDLRTTFFNRCIECNIKESVRDKWMGHTSTAIKQAYTDITDDLHLQEAEKFAYFLL